MSTINKENIEIRDITNCQLDYKANIVKEILDELPEWFSIEDANIQYAEDAKDQNVYIASLENKPIAFMNFKGTSEDSIELACVGVLKEFHRYGLGTRIFNTAMKDLSDNYTFIQVKTVAPGYYPEYDRTNEFYRSLGFKKLEVISKIWNEENPCLILIKYIGDKHAKR